MCDAADSRIPPAPMPNGPTPSPTRREPTRNAPAESCHWRGMPRARIAAPLRARTESTAIYERFATAATARARLTMRGPQREATLSSIATTRCLRTADDPRPARARGERPERLAAADRVGEDDDVGIRRDDVLGGELRVAGVRRVCCIGDVAEAEQPVDAADEGRRSRRVVRRIELVVDLEVPRLRRDAPDERRERTLHRADEPSSSPARARSRGRAGGSRRTPAATLSAAGSSSTVMPSFSSEATSPPSIETTTRSGSYDAIASTFGVKPESFVRGARFG